MTMEGRPPTGPSSGRKLHVPKSELTCKTGCGFYGNVAWKGYCSKCYKEHFLHQHRIAEGPARKSSSSSSSSVGVAPAASGSSGGRFEEKKRSGGTKDVMRSPAVKSLFRKASMAGRSAEAPAGAAAGAREGRALSPDSQAATQGLDRFLRALPQPAAHHAYNFLKAHVDKLDRLVSAGVLTPNDISERVHVIYQTFGDKIKQNQAYEELDGSTAQELVDQGERYLTSVLYRKLFGPANCDDEERDLAIQKRIRGLGWISAPLLDCRINELHSKVRDILEKAITDLIGMDAKRAPQDKLQSIISCSQKVFDMLGVAGTPTEAPPASQAPPTAAPDPPAADPVSADDFLPALIYVVLRANPPRLHSNLNFITRYAAPGRLMQGEGGYYFTNLCCAVSFLENLTSDSLGLSDDEFERYMTGKAIPFASLQAGVMDSEGLRLMYQNMSILTELRAKQQTLQQQAQQLQLDMESFSAAMRGVVEETVRCFPVEVRGRRAPVRPDDERPEDSETLALLPPPLLPQIAGPAHPSGPAPTTDAASTETTTTTTTTTPPPPPIAAIAQFDDFDLFAPVDAAPGGAGGDDEPLSLTVQGRIIPCIPCDITTTTTTTTASSTAAGDPP